MPNHPVVEVNFAVSPAGLESESPASLAHAAHLQNLGGGKLVQIADKRVTRIDPFGGVPGLPFKSRDHARNWRRNWRSLQLVATNSIFCCDASSRMRGRSSVPPDTYLQGGKMLAGIGRLFDRDPGFAFHDEEIEIFAHQNVNRFLQGSDDTGFDLWHGVEHGERTVFENGIGIED